MACFIYINQVFAVTDIFSLDNEAPPTTTQEEAIKFIDKIGIPAKSEQWPNINPAKFIENLKLNIHQPLSMYPGIGTNFCGYGSIAYLLLQDNPLGYAKFMLSLYTDGQGQMGKSVFKPADIIKKTAGRLKFKGILDIRPAEQMFYLTMADHFKGYLNFFNRKYDPGDENHFWASVNYAKFNRMVRKMLNYNVYARGTDLIQPFGINTYEYISEKLNDGIVVLYLNNRILHKKKHEKLKFKVPTHFVILEQIYKSNDMLTLIYWDYGHRTLLQLKPEFLHKIVYGISQCIKNSSIEK